MSKPLPRKNDAATVLAQPWPWHWAYYVLYELALIAALWQHGQPYFTLCLLILTPPLAAAAYLPVKWLPLMVRTLGQHLVGIGALVWGGFRLSHHVPVDVLLVEAFAAMGLGFAFAPSRQGYSLVLVITTILFAYGALLPPREMYLLVLPPGLLLLLWLLYQSRVVGLAGQAAVELRHSVRLPNWPVLLMHTCLAAAIFPLVVMVLPKQSVRSRGLAPVGYRAPTTIPLAPRITDWFNTPEVSRSAVGNRSLSGNDDPEQSSTAMVTVTNMKGQDGISAGASGMSPPGKDLVMRVQCPVRLYWLACLYDDYDGDEWHASKAMLDQRRHGFLADATGAASVVPQVYVIEKWESSRLYAAFRPQSFAHSPGPPLAVQSSFFGQQLTATDKRPALPYTYTVESLVSDLPGARDKAYSTWSETLPPAHYLQLPEKAITPRVRALATELTDTLTTPLLKAYALRDYLRKNFRYTLTPKPVPPGREAADYLLFDLKEGHCQYYATALCVLARAAGLPARVATGFSPGNYNKVTSMFEVYEYHAHAWTQIYIAGDGWLTMDGTPPGAPQLDLTVTPPLPGNWGDPFSDDWRVKTPELSNDLSHFFQTMQAELQAALASASANNVSTPPTRPRPKVFDPSEATPGNVRPATSPASATASEKAPGRIAFDNLLATIKASLHTILRNLQESLDRLVNRINAADLVVLLTLVLCLLVVLLFLPRLRAEWRFNRRLRRCDQWFAKAEQARTTAPDQCVQYCYLMLRELLLLTGWPRPSERDLLAYGIGLQELDPSLSRDALTIFTAYSAVRYSPDRPTRRDAEAVFARAEAARHFLLTRFLGAK